MKNRFLYLTAALGMMLGFSSCNLDYFPSDEMNSDLLLQDVKGAEYIMDGCYAIMKDEVEFLGYSSGNCYIRHYTQLTEYPSDNICLSAHSEDPFYEATAYMMNDGLKNVGTLWMVAYKIIFMTNTVIATLDETNEDNHQLLGEAYFMRALMHLHMVTMFAKPYHEDERDNMGVPLRVSTSSEVTKRNPVGEVYDQIVADLRKAADLMGPSRGNKGYPSHDAALGVLSRVYLLMEKYDDCIATVNKMLNGATALSKLDPDLATYFQHTKDRDETLFCIAHDMSDNRGQSSIGSMFLKDGIGWGEVYPSFPLLYLYDRYPQDIRYKDLIRPQYKGNDNMYIYFPDPESIGESGSVLLQAKLTDDGEGNYSFKQEGVTYNVEKRKVNGEAKADPSGEYFEYFVNYGGMELQARVDKELNLRPQYSFPQIFNIKYCYQDGDPMLSSPVICRWGEVILNRAEAYARTGKDAEALEDVNAIRTRAGIPSEGMFAVGNLHGYDNVINVVMDERRLELAFEGFRMSDVYRNKKDMDRRYPGIQPWKVIPYTEPHIQYPIPNNEWTVSKIPQNPGY